MGAASGGGAVTAPDAAPGTDAIARRLGPPALRLGVLVVIAYGCCLLIGERLAGWSIGTGTAVAMFSAAAVLVGVAIRWQPVASRLTPARRLEIGAALLLSMTVIFAGDVALAIRDNVTARRTAASTSGDQREQDDTIWHGELYPRMYSPPGSAVSLYKPNVVVSGDTYGERYVSSMRRSPTLARSVLERRRLSYAIGPEGLRERESLADSRIVAIGDSFVFGFATDEGRTWTDLLGGLLGQPVYNMGVSATGPRAQLELLKYMFARYPESMRPTRVIWMIFEGNDLENSYATSPQTAGPTGPGLLDGTVLQSLAEIPERVKDQSFVRRLVRGQLRLTGAAPRFGEYEVDGVALAVPLFRSSRFGPRLFVPADTEAATRPKEYVMNHPNRPLLDATFGEMRTLGMAKGFEVTVVVAPSDARLYGRAFEGFPPVSAQPHFVDYVVALAQRSGFEAVNLLPLLQPFADREMLYYRDDHHWNVRGNAVVAQLLASALGRPEQAP